jgi:O-antigen ligase
MAGRRADSGLVSGYGLILGLVGLSAALFLVHAGRILNFGFPALATAVAGALFVTRRSLYAAFVWWIWLFTPLVRRLVDYQSSYHNISPVMVTPLLVTGFALVAIMLRPWFVLQRRMAPFLLVLLALVLALVVGVVTNGPLPAVYDFANWLLPLAFAVFLMMYPDEFKEMKAELLFAIILGLVLIAGYGLYQFYHIPPWDAFWISASQFTTAGLAQDEEVRLFGTLNSPGPYAIALMASLVFVVVAKGPVRLVGGALGFPAFLLSLVRSAWGGWALAALFIVWRVGGRTRLRILVAGFVIAVAAVPLVTAGPVANAISARFATLNNVQQDSSFRARQSLYESTTITAFDQPIGTGLGQFGLASKLTTGQTAVFDSGLLQIPFEFGWVGSSLLLWALGTFVLRVLAVTRMNADRIAIAGGGLFLAMLLQNIFSSTFGGVLGISLWTGLALALGPVTVSRPALQIAMDQGRVQNRQLV